MSSNMQLHLDEKGYEEIEVTARDHPSQYSHEAFCTLSIEAALPGRPRDAFTLFLTEKQLDHILHECAKLYEKRLMAQEEVRESDFDSSERRSFINPERAE